jgi:hypothetical protein
MACASDGMVVLLPRNAAHWQGMCVAWHGIQQLLLSPTELSWFELQSHFGGLNRLPACQAEPLHRRVHGSSRNLSCTMGDLS